LAKSTIRPEDGWNLVRHLGLERGFLPSIAVQIAVLEFANSVYRWASWSTAFRRILWSGSGGNGSIPDHLLAGQGGLGGGKAGNRYAVG
jgi:hypothetical protein